MNKKYAETVSQCLHVYLLHLKHLKPSTNRLPIGLILCDAKAMQSLLTPLGLHPTSRQLAQLEQYQKGLLDWNQRINLIAVSTEPTIATRHIQDSAQVVPLLPGEPASILDVGSGAGLPGLILAILAPQHHYTLAEKVQKKAAFLSAMAKELGLANVTVHPARVELLKPHTYDVITCRAWANLTDILKLTRPLLSSKGCWCLLKGEAFQTELEACPQASKMTIERHRSITSPSGVVVRLTPAKATR
jgi:16S rRNA (guanine527-N7)-methyltransferase